jgi:predicted nucleotidyltransferase
LHRNGKQGKGTAIMDKKEAIKKLKKYKEMLSKEMVFDKMILLGSYAEGNPREDSDIDVAIIVNKIQGDFFHSAFVMENKWYHVLRIFGLFKERLNHYNELR